MARTFVAGVLVLLAVSIGAAPPSSQPMAQTRATSQTQPAPQTWTMPTTWPAPQTQPVAQTLAAALTQPAAQTHPAADQEALMKKALQAGFSPLVEPTPEGGIDWTKGVVRAVGKAKAGGAGGREAALAKRGAQLVAARNAILLIGRIRVDASGRFATLREGAISVDAVLEDYQTVASDFDPQTGEATATIEVPLYGASGVVRLTDATFRDTLRAWEWPVQSAAGFAPAVVIDARGIGFAPCLAPVVETVGGERVFGPSNVPADQAALRSAVLYLRMEQEGVSRDARSPVLAPIARAKDVVAAAGTPDAPLAEAARRTFAYAIVLPAQATAKDRPGALVLSERTLAVLDVRSDGPRLMREGCLVIVCDAPAAK